MTCYNVFAHEVIWSITVEEDRFGFEPEATGEDRRNSWMPDLRGGAFPILATDELSERSESTPGRYRSAARGTHGWPDRD